MNYTIIVMKNNSIFHYTKKGFIVIQRKQCHVAIKRTGQRKANTLDFRD